MAQVHGDEGNGHGQQIEFCTEKPLPGQGDILHQQHQQNSRA